MYLTKVFLVSITILLISFSASARLAPYALVGAWDFEDTDNPYKDVSGYEPDYSLSSDTFYKVGNPQIVFDADRGSKVFKVGPTNSTKGHVEFGPYNGSGKFVLYDAVSLAFWIKADKNDYWWMYCLGKGGDSYRIFRHGPYMMLMPQISYNDGGSDFWSNCLANAPDAGVWYHIGYTYDGENVVIWVNGELGGVVPAPGFDTINGAKREMWTGAMPFAIGGSPITTIADHFSGSLDDVAVWHGVVSGDDFAAIYNGTKTVQEVSVMPSYREFKYDNDLVGAWHFEEGAGAVSTADLSPGPAADAAFSADSVIVSDPEQGNVLSYSTDPALAYVDGGTAEKYESYNDTGVTVTAWIKPDSLHETQWAWLIGKGGSGFRFFTHAGGLIAVIDVEKDGVNTTHIAEGAWGALQPGNWYHVAMVYVPAPLANEGVGLIKLYIDGLEFLGEYPVNNQNIDGTVLDTTGVPITIKSPQPGDLLNFSGQIDDVRVYYDTLNEHEVRWTMDPWCDSAVLLGRDLTNDCIVDIDDLQVAADNWLNRYDLGNLALISQRWLSN